MKALRFVSSLALVCCCLGVTAGIAVAAPGDLDRSFGQEGVVTLSDLGGVRVAASGMAVGPDNAIYVLRRQLGCFQPGCGVSFLVTRQIPNGTPDTSFGAGGVGNAFGSLNSLSAGQPGSLALAPDGKILVAATEGQTLLLSRLNSNGSLDGAFGQGGIVKTDLGTTPGRARVAVHGDGKVVVAVERATAGGSAVVVFQYTQDGVPDPSFNGGAPVVTSFESGLGGLDVSGDGGLVIAGPTCCGAADQPVRVGRITSGGVFDTSFGGTGQRFVDDVARAVEVGAVVVLPDGKIDVVGTGRIGGNAFALRLRTDGKLDRTFGHRGIAYMNRSYLKVVGAAVDDKRRLAIVGSTPFRRAYGANAENGRVTVLRRLSDGRQDGTFGGGSPVQLRSPQPSRAVAGAAQSHGRILVLAETGECSRSCPPTKTLLIRYLGGDSRARCAGRKATIVGTRRSETLTGTAHRDVIVALGGDDVVRGRGGNDLICGGLGNDHLNGGKGRDRLLGGAGRNQLRQ